MKKEFFNTIENLTGGNYTECKKMSLENIVFPKWNDLGLLGMMFRQCVVTKEAPNGNIYDEASFRTVLRVLDGKVLMNGFADSYAWDYKTFEKKAKTCVPIGCNSASGLINLSRVILSIRDDEERSSFADMMSKMKEDLLLVTTAEEERKCVEITQELYDNGLTYSIDSWVEPDANGVYPLTNLCVGDFLIIDEQKRTAYCIRREEFLLTHKLV